jgi:L-lactate dehydrogenase complex protein LldG
VNEAREAVLARIRAALPAPPAGPVEVPRGYDAGDADGGPDLIELLVDRLVDYRATVRRCGPAELAATIAALLDGEPTVVAPVGVPAAWLDGYTGEVRRDDPPLRVADLDRPGTAVLTGCAVAIAVTGTLILDAGPDQGRRLLTLVPDHHVCVLDAGQVVAGVPEALRRIAAPTRPLTLVSGPSATSDIELNRVEGVHGPRRLDVVVVEAAG